MLSFDVIKDDDSLQKQGSTESPNKSKKWTKGVITGIPTDITVEDIKIDTGAIWAHRITKRKDGNYMSQQWL